MTQQNLVSSYLLWCYPWKWIKQNKVREFMVSLYKEKGRKKKKEQETFAKYLKNQNKIEDSINETNKDTIFPSDLSPELLSISTDLPE